MKILHIITGLQVGGAETALYRLLASSHPEGIEHRVIALSAEGPLGNKLREMGVEVRALGLAPGRPNPIRLITLHRWMKSMRPDLVHCWMYHANLFGGLIAKATMNTPILWSIRQDISDRSWIKPSTWWVIRIGGLLAKRIPDGILSVSERAVGSHAAIGYPKEKTTVISNGFDTRQFRPDPSARKSLREELALKAENLLLGYFARYHPMKDHQTFLQAAGLATKALPGLHFLLCGKGVDVGNQDLISAIEHEGLAGRVHLLGQRDDMPRLHAGLDIYSISSRSEGFPQSVGEAMACGIPCVVTDVGDTARLVGDTGLVVAPRKPKALANAWVELLSGSQKQRAALGKAARLRVVQQFSLEAVIVDYYNLYDQFHQNI